MLEAVTESKLSFCIQIPPSIDCKVFLEQYSIALTNPFQTLLQSKQALHEWAQNSRDSPLSPPLELSEAQGNKR